MHVSSSGTYTTVSPHKLFQLLYKAVEANDQQSVQTLVSALVQTVSGNQTLATPVVMELFNQASRNGCAAGIKEALALLPGFKAEAAIGARPGPSDAASSRY